MQMSRKTDEALSGGLVNWQAKPEQNCVGVTAGKPIPIRACWGTDYFKLLSQLVFGVCVAFC